MIFEYGEYKDKLFYEPLLGLIICLIGFIYIAHEIIMEIKYRGSSTHPLLALFFGLVITVAILPSTIINLRYGVFTIFENETHIEEYIGTIESIKEASFARNYDYNGDSVRLQIVIVDDELYLFMTTGDLIVGDNVIIEYLPYSRIVLEWQHNLDIP
ncbi:MAG: hypothetical protein KKH01_01780 [Firmicutes bacterium]|nr:hypothetical protein [Bacillota bacterium]